MSIVVFDIVYAYFTRHSTHAVLQQIEYYNAVKDTLANRKTDLVANGENLSLPLSPMKDRLLYDEVGNVCPGDRAALVTVSFDDPIRLILPAPFVGLALSVS